MPSLKPWLKAEPVRGRKIDPRLPFLGALQSCKRFSAKP